MGVARTAGRTLAAAVTVAALMAFAAGPAIGVAGGDVAVEPVIGPERPVSYPVPGTPQEGFYPAVASSGSVHLVVWQGGLAARVDRSGTVLDPSPIRLPFGLDPDAAFDGENFLVVWSGSGDVTGGVWGTRVSPAGEVLDVPPIRLSEAAGYGPKISFDGTDLLVVWRADGGIAGTRVSRAGTVLDPVTPLVSSYVYQEIAIAFNGSDHLLTWAQADAVQPVPPGRPGPVLDVFGTLVTPAGVPSHPTGVGIAVAPGSQGNPAVSRLGDAFFVTWDSAATPASDRDVFGARVDATGMTIDPLGIPIATGPEHQGSPDVAYDGVNVMVLWGTRGVRIDQAGVVLDPSGFPVPAGAGGDVVFDGEDYFAIGSVDSAVVGARITPAGAALDPAGIVISVGANRQLHPTTAFDGTNTLVIWHDDRRPGAGLYGARVGPDGQILDGQGFRISDGTPPEGGSVAFDGTNFLVVWGETRAEGPVRAIRAARVSRDGMVLDRFDVSVGTPEEQPGAPRVVWGGGTFLVAWTHLWYRNGDVGTELRAARVSPGGVVTDPTAFLVSGQDHFGFDVAFGDTEFLFVWEAYGQGPNLDVSGTRVTTAGTVPAPGGFPIAATAAHETNPVLAWNGDHHLVVWLSGDVDRWDVHGARVDGSGVRLDPDDIVISAGPNQKRTPDVAANGPFLVTWTDGRRGEWQNSVFGARVDPDGTVAHPDGFELLPPPVANAMWSYHLTPAAEHGTFSFTYARDVPEQPYGTTRTFIRKVSPK